MSCKHTGVLLGARDEVIEERDDVTPVASQPGRRHGPNRERSTV
jgi:hypothetical protein